MQHNKEVRGVWKDYRGEEVAGSSMCINYGTFRWVLISEQDTKEAFGPIVELYYLLSKILLTLFIGTLLIAFLISRSFCLPIVSLIRETKVIALGDLTSRIEVGQSDEIGELATSFNHMVNELEKAQNKITQTNEELDNFAYIISHDLKAPLRAINQLSEFLLDDFRDQLNHEGQDMLNLISKRAMDMQNMITGVLDYSRIGRVSTPNEELDLNNLIMDVASMYASSPEVKVKIIKNLPTLHGAKILLQQLFQNLISNAVKYGDKEETHIEIDFESKGKNYEFTVADNGPGIPEKYQAKIFEIFQTLESKSKSQSTGIGLSIVKRIVKTWDGEIGVRSEAQNGSTFFFTFPKMK